MKQETEFWLKEECRERNLAHEQCRERKLCWKRNMQRTDWLNNIWCRGPPFSRGKQRSLNILLSNTRNSSFWEERRGEEDELEMRRDETRWDERQRTDERMMLRWWSKVMKLNKGRRGWAAWGISRPGNCRNFSPLPEKSGNFSNKNLEVFRSVFRHVFEKAVKAQRKIKDEEWCWREISRPRVTV